MAAVHTTDAWVLEAGDGRSEPGELVLREITFPDINRDEVLVEPICGSWEGNMAHAIDRQPIDICHFRNEPEVVLGNSGVVRALKVGEAVSGITEGACYLFAATGVPDKYGYLALAHAYDAPNTVGLLARRTKVPGRNLFPLPENTRFTHAQWAVFSARYMTAWSNWQVAYRCFRTQLSEEDLPHPHVWGWGGGTTLAELDLARMQGCHSVMASATPENLAQIEKAGISALDRREYPALNYDPDRYRTDSDYRDAYRDSERRFLDAVAEKTDQEGVSIFVDYIGAPVSRVTQKALGRMGVITTAGWKLGLSTPLNRASEAIARHIHVHTHYARFAEIPPAMRFGEEHGWMPDVATNGAYSFDEIPKLVHDYNTGRTGYFPIYEVNG